VAHRLVRDGGVCRKIRESWFLRGTRGEMRVIRGSWREARWGVGRFCGGFDGRRWGGGRGGGNLRDMLDIVLGKGVMVEEAAGYRIRGEFWKSKIG